MNKYHPQGSRTRLATQTQIRLGLSAIFLLAVFFGLIVYPWLPDTFPGSSFFKQFKVHLGLDLQGGTHLVYEADLSKISAADKNTSLEGVRDVIERRINSLGVSEPVVQATQQAGHSRVIIELAGIQDVNEAIQKIGETPLLEFKEVGVVAPTETATSSAQISEVEKYNKEQEKKANDVLSQLKKGTDFAELANKYSEDEGSKGKGGDLGWAQRNVFIDAFATEIFDVMKVGEISTTPFKTQFGYHIIKKIEEKKDDKGIVTEVHAAHILLMTKSLDQQQPAINWVNTSLSGKDLKRADVIFSSQSTEPEVQLTFTAEGAELFKQITERNLNKEVGIFLDGDVISAPTVQSVITGGQAVITGNFQLEEAKLLAQRLNAGALPVPIKLVSQQTVGATLGSDSLEKSLFAGLVGLIAVALFMILYYRLPGLISVLALFLYSIITLGLFEIIPVTLTIAGIAGFILSIGMAVDANVLIFERLKEELKKGDTFVMAVEESFRRAWSSIRDSNVSSLITCAILYWFGSSIIRGFAVTLGLGILVSMFSAITVTRTFLRVIVKRPLIQKFWLYSVKKPNATT